MLVKFRPCGMITEVVLGDGRRRAVDRSQLETMSHPMHARRPPHHPDVKEVYWHDRHGWLGESRIKLREDVVVNASYRVGPAAAAGTMQR
jgi:hypothetical protein